MMFIKKAPNSHGWVNPRDVEELWLDQFNFFYREYDEFVYPVTVHPDGKQSMPFIWSLKIADYEDQCVVTPTGS